MVIIAEQWRHCSFTLCKAVEGLLLHLGPKWSWWHKSWSWCEPSGLSCDLQIENCSMNCSTTLRRCRRRASPSDEEARSVQRSGGFQHQDAASHPHRPAQWQSGQPGQEEPQEEGGGHRNHDLLPVGPRTCACVCVCVCVFVCVTHWHVVL